MKNSLIICAAILVSLFSVTKAQTKFKIGTYKSERDPQLQELDYSGSSLNLQPKNYFELEFHDMASSTKITGKWHVKKDTLYLVNSKQDKKNKNRTPSVIAFYKYENLLCPVKYTYIRCMGLGKK